MSVCPQALTFAALGAFAWGSQGSQPIIDIVESGREARVHSGAVSVSLVFSAEGCGFHGHSRLIECR